MGGTRNSACNPSSKRLVRSRRAQRPFAAGRRRTSHHFADRRDRQRNPVRLDGRVDGRRGPLPARRTSWPGPRPSSAFGFLACSCLRAPPLPPGSPSRAAHSSPDSRTCPPDRRCSCRPGNSISSGVGTRSRFSPCPGKVIAVVIQVDIRILRGVEAAPLAIVKPVSIQRIYPPATCADSGSTTLSKAYHIVLPAARPSHIASSRNSAPPSASSTE